MKKLATFIIIPILFLAGLSLLLYPLVANKWNDYRQSQLISSYDTEISQMEEEGGIDYEAQWAMAHAFNDELVPYILPDSFAIAEATEENDAYMACLNLTGNGIMGYVEIPKIDVKIPIYHTTSDEVLQIAAGHLEGSSLPVGGENTHAVISAHRGLPSATLFTDLDRLEDGDYFLLYILDDVLCYQVDQTTVVEPQETEALSVVKGEDLVTLLTCTPYGVNSHRMLVRGHRVPYEPEVVEESVPTAMPPSLHTNYSLWVIIGLTVVVEESVPTAMPPSLHTNYSLWVIIGLTVTGAFIFLLYLFDRRRRSRTIDTAEKNIVSEGSTDDVLKEVAPDSDMDWMDLDVPEEKQ